MGNYMRKQRNNFAQNCIFSGRVAGDQRVCYFDNYRINNKRTYKLGITDSGDDITMLVTSMLQQKINIYFIHQNCKIVSYFKYCKEKEKYCENSHYEYPLTRIEGYLFYGKKSSLILLNEPFISVNTKHKFWQDYIYSAVKLDYLVANDHEAHWQNIIIKCPECLKIYEVAVSGYNNYEYRFLKADY